MRIRSLRLLAAASIVVGIHSAGALADPAPQWEFGGFGGGHFFSDNAELGARDVSDAPSPDNSVAFGLRLGYWFAPMVGVEVEGAAMPTEAKAQSASSEEFVVGYRASAILQFDTGRIRPFLLAGAGGESNSSERDDILMDDTDFVFHAGGGARFALGENWGLRADARLLLPPSSASEGVTAEFEGLIGLYRVFGGASAPADADGDGVLGASDRCPNEPEDKDSFQDEDGCPDADNDGDGIADASDKCPSEAETKNGFEDEDGCADQVPAAVAQFTGTIQGINFQLNSAQLTKASLPTLDAAVKVLQEYPNIRLEIGGHTDTNGEAEYNRRLSQKRADKVKEYLVSKGVAADRLEAKGYGPDKPIADNNTREGQMQNRRVEFTLLSGGSPAGGTAPSGATPTTPPSGTPPATQPQAPAAQPKAPAAQPKARAKEPAKDQPAEPAKAPAPQPKPQP